MEESGNTDKVGVLRYILLHRTPANCWYPRTMSVLVGVSKLVHRGSASGGTI
jgi:hypothetical protein